MLLEKKILRFLELRFSQLKFCISIVTFCSKSPWNRKTQRCGKDRPTLGIRVLDIYLHVGGRSRHLGTRFRFRWVVALPMAWDPSPGCPAAVFNQRNRVLADHAKERVGSS